MRVAMCYGTIMQGMQEWQSHTYIQCTPVDRGEKKACPVYMYMYKLYTQSAAMA